MGALKGWVFTGKYRTLELFMPDGRVLFQPLRYRRGRWGIVCDRGRFYAVDLEAPICIYDERFSKAVRVQMFDLSRAVPLQDDGRAASAAYQATRAVKHPKLRAAYGFVTFQKPQVVDQTGEAVAADGTYPMKRVESLDPGIREMLDDPDKYPTPGEWDRILDGLPPAYLGKQVRSMSGYLDSSLRTTAADITGSLAEAYLQFENAESDLAQVKPRRKNTTLAYIMIIGAVGLMGGMTLYAFDYEGIISIGLARPIQAASGGETCDALQIQQRYPDGTEALMRYQDGTMGCTPTDHAARLMDELLEGPDADLVAERRLAMTVAEEPEVEAPVAADVVEETDVGCSVVDLYAKYDSNTSALKAAILDGSEPCEVPDRLREVLGIAGE